MLSRPRLAKSPERLGSRRRSAPVKTSLFNLRAHTRESASYVLTTLDFRFVFTKRHCSSTGRSGHTSAAPTHSPRETRDLAATSFASLCCCSFFFLLFSLFFSFVVGLFPKA